MQTASLRARLLETHVLTEIEDAVHARHFYEQKPGGLSSKIREQFRESVLHMFILEPRIIG